MKESRLFVYTGVAMMIFTVILLVIFEVIPGKPVDFKTMLLGFAAVLAWSMVLFGKLLSIEERLDKE